MNSFRAMFIDDWKFVVKTAWSIRTGILAAFCAGMQEALPYLPWNIPPGLFVALTLLFALTTPFARVIDQKRAADGQ